MLLEKYWAYAQVPALADTHDKVRMTSIRDRFVDGLKDRLGDVVGYKAALTGTAAQQRFSTHEPVLGTLLDGMLLHSPAQLPQRPGIRPVYEADLLVRVRDAGINDARTREELLMHLDAVIPFVEVPDLVFAPGVGPDAGMLTAINAGARLGVMGKPVQLGGDHNWLKRLEQFEVQIWTRSSPEHRVSGRGDQLLGHPLAVVAWLRDELKARGHKLSAGDLLSLGSLTQLQAVVPGSRVTARYTGLDPCGAVEVVVDFSL